MNDILGIKNDKIIADYHIHFGQFYDVYYRPAFVIAALAANGVKKVWGSSTTACLRWNTLSEKQYILSHIEEEIKEALFAASKYAMDFAPLYRVIPRLHSEGTSIEEVMNSSFYKGFKIHPLDEGFENEASSDMLMEEVCKYASAHRFPILVHTGEDACVDPERFEKFFGIYKNVKFVLAHCKEVEKVISLFNRHNNVFGDTAFCPYESYHKICECGYKRRMQFGTDFPITHWYNTNKNVGIMSKQTLISNYKKVINEFYLV